MQTKLTTHLNIRLLIGLAFLFIVVPCYSQTIDWQHAYGGADYEHCYGVVKYSSGGYVFTSEASANSGDVTTGTNGYEDYWIVKINDNGTIQWTNTFGGPGTDEPYDIVEAYDGGLVMCGAGELNGGDITGNHGSYDVWVTKTDANGNLLWQKSLGGSGGESGVKILETLDHGFVITGTTTSNNGDVSGNHGSVDAWVVKIDSIGNFVWQRCIGGPDADIGADLIELSDGSIIMAGTAGNPGGDVPSSLGGGDFLLAKLTPTGVLVWAYTFGGTQQDQAHGLALCEDGGFIMTGKTYSTDGLLSINYGASDCWIVKTTSNGILQWHKLYGGDSYDYGWQIKTTDDGGYSMVAGSNSTTGSFDQNYGNYDAWLLKLDNLGNIEWKNNYGGSLEEIPRRLLNSDDYGFMLAGFTYSNNGDVSGNHGGGDAWLLRVRGKRKAKLIGKVFIDNNINGVFDAGEPPLPYIEIKSIGIYDTSICYSNSQGVFKNYMELGSYVTQPILGPLYPYTPLTSLDTLVNFEEIYDTAYFAIQPGSFIDAAITMTPMHPARAGFPTHYRINFSNLGITSLNDTIELTTDSALVFTSSVPTPDYINGNTLKWAYSAFPFDQGQIDIYFNVQPIPLVSIGELVSSEATIYPLASDTSTSNNHAYIRHPIVVGYDPNDKSITSDQFLSPVDVVNQEEILYLIRFQNTGNDTAFNIYITDTLDSQIDENSFRVIAASHPCNGSLLDFTTLRFDFDNILLPDSNINEPESHGFVLFGIKPGSTLVVGDTIHNIANIYFDFNPPVITNEFNIPIVQPILLQTDLTHTYGDLPFTVTPTYNFSDPIQFEILSGSSVNVDSLTGHTSINQAGITQVLVSQTSQLLVDTFEVEVIKADLQVVANDTAKVYLAPNPPLLYSITGFVYAEDSTVLAGSPSISTTATLSSPVGSYVISMSPGSLSSINYNFNCQDGNLLIYNDISIETENDNQVLIYPNPLVDKLNVVFNNLPSATYYKIYSIYGGVVVTGMIKEKNSMIDLSFLDSGIYLFEIDNGVQKSSVRIVKVN